MTTTPLSIGEAYEMTQAALHEQDAKLGKEFDREIAYVNTAITKAARVAQRRVGVEIKPALRDAIRGAFSKFSFKREHYECDCAEGDEPCVDVISW